MHTCLLDEQQQLLEQEMIQQAGNQMKGVTFQNCALCINCKSEINNAEIDNVKDIYLVMAMYNLIEYSDKYSKTSGSTSGNTSGNTKDVEIIVPLKYLSNF